MEPLPRASRSTSRPDTQPPIHLEVQQVALLRRDLYVVLPITESIGHRDLLTAAFAEHHGAVVMHYDADFEHIAASTGQPHTWIQPKGNDRVTSPCRRLQRGPYVGSCG